MTGSERHWKADILMVLVTLLAAVGWLSSKETMQGLPPLLFLGLRFLLAGLLLAVVGIHSLSRLDRGSWLRASGTGAMMTTALIFWIMALHHAHSVGVGAFITSLGVILAPVVGRVLFGVPVAVSTWLAVLVAAVGMGCLSLQGGLQFERSDMLFLVAACGFAVHFNLNTRFAQRIPVVALSAIQLSIVGSIALLISLPSEPWPEALDSGIILWLIVSILIATSLRFFLQIKAQGMVPLNHAALIMTLEPIWVALVGLFWFGETMNGLQFTGCSLIFCALLIDRWRWILRRPEARKPH